ncbi:hypothetical protein [Cyanobacterium sp. Dongsha4]|uniref:hypothetical protein n=1 Tax=Cyanobacterium sp. DS4 TaxID=2878255 RepID=UPI002E80432D|nr:hypothetical protein [Cyanobacterium sp. Dongsha4]WVL00883.1 hypothetical protein Dongsha4_01410 [Cyanobacterium sp. Dongsha4]
MNDSLNQIQQTIILMKYYSFDLNSYQFRELIAKWTKIYPHNWLPLAVTEAIYQGRLKAVSVEQILNVWQKKGKIQHSFNYEFVRLIKPDFTEEELNKYLDIAGSFISDLFSPENMSKQWDYDTKETNYIEANLTVNDFNPVEDFSHCFQKLKGFVVEHK